MIGRLGISMAVWLFGLLFVPTWNGQVFTQNLQLLSCAVLGSLPWVSLVSRRQETRRRTAAIAVLGLSAAVIILLSLQLPTDYKAQRKFNERAATPNHGLQSDDHLPRFARSGARR